MPRPERGRKTFRNCEDRYGYSRTAAKEEQTPFRDLRGTTGLIQSYKHFLPWLKPICQGSTRTESLTATGKAWSDMILPCQTSKKMSRNGEGSGRT